jgi:hypothetical protein
MAEPAQRLPRFTSQNMQDLYNNLLRSYAANTNVNNPNNITRNLKFNNNEFRAYIEALNNTSKIDNLEGILKQINPEIARSIDQLPNNNLKTTLLNIVTSSKYYSTLYSLSSYTYLKIFKNIEKYQQDLHKTIIDTINKFIAKIADINSRTSRTRTPNAPAVQNPIINDSQINPASYRDLESRFNNLVRDNQELSANYNRLTNIVNTSVQSLNKAGESLDNANMHADINEIIKGMRDLKISVNTTTNNINTASAELDNRIQSAGGKKKISKKTKKIKK